MRREIDDLTAIGVTAVLSGALMGSASVTLFITVTMGERSALAVFAMSGGLAGGAFLGLFSLAYLYPTLRRTRLRASLPLVFGLSVPIGVGAGALHPLFGAGGALCAQLGTSVLSMLTLRRPRDDGHTCESCGYSLRGIMPDYCPECGAPCLDMPRVVEGICPACRRLAPMSAAHPRCPHCGTIDLELALGGDSTVNRSRT